MSISASAAAGGCRFEVRPRSARRTSHRAAVSLLTIKFLTGNCGLAGAARGDAVRVADGNAVDWRELNWANWDGRVPVHPGQ